MNSSNVERTVYDDEILISRIKDIIANTVDNLNHHIDWYLSKNSHTMLKPAIGYIRYSSLNQKDRFSVDIQKQEITRRAKEEGYYIILWCIDEAVSATHNTAIKRPWMKVLYQVAKLDEFHGAIFFYDDSRISRQATDFVRQIYEPLLVLKPYLKFFSSDIKGVWNPNDPLIQIMSLINREKSLDLRDKILHYHKTSLYPENEADFRRPGSHLPYGYVKGTEYNPQIDVSNGQAHVVLLIFYLSSWGYSNIDIANFLNKCDIASPKGKKWSQGTIDKILHNQFYLGNTTWDVRKDRKNSKRKPAGQYDLFHDTHTGIIPHFLSVLVEQTKNFKIAFGQKMNTPFLLKDLIMCRKCNCRLTTKNTTSGKSKSSKRVYRCNSCKEYVSIDTIHEVVYNKLFSFLSVNKIEMKNGSKKLLTNWKNELKSKSKVIDDQIEKVKYKERTFNYELIGYEEEIKHEIKLMITNLQNHKVKIQRLSEKIDQLLDDSELDSLFNVFFESTTESLSQTELRCFTLYFISEIKYDFKTEKTAIKFGKSPFLNVEKWVMLLAS